MKKKLLWLVMGCLPLYAQVKNQPPIQLNTIVITSKSLNGYRTNIDNFIKTKRGEKNILSQLPDGNSFFGRAANFVIENLLAPIFSIYGEVELERAKDFLGRCFENEQLLMQAINSLEKNQDNLDYLNTIFKQASKDNILSKKDGPRFLKIVKTTKHKGVPNPTQMGNKNSNGEYIIPDDDFYRFSASTLMAFHIFENHISDSQPTKKKRKVKDNKTVQKHTEVTYE